MCFVYLGLILEVAHTFDHSKNSLLSFEKLERPFFCLLLFLYYSNSYVYFWIKEMSPQFLFFYIFYAL